EGSVAGVLDRDPVAGPNVGVEHPLDAAQRAADHAHQARAHPLGTQLARRVLQQRDDGCRFAVPVAGDPGLRTLRRKAGHRRRLTDAILDEALLAHLGLSAADGQPLVLPMLHARRGDLVYLHGSAGGRTLRALRAGTPACLTVSLLDGLVLARAAMHHSANYRSVVLLGRARAVEDPEEKRLACREIVEHIVPGRWQDVRPPSESELKATA